MHKSQLLHANPLDRIMCIWLGKHLDFNYLVTDTLEPPKRLKVSQKNFPHAFIAYAVHTGRNHVPAATWLLSKGLSCWPPTSAAFLSEIPWCVKSNVLHRGVRLPSMENFIRFWQQFIRKDRESSFQHTRLVYDTDTAPTSGATCQSATAQLSILYMNQPS